VADVDVTGLAIEAPPPRVAQTDDEDLGLATAGGKRVVGRNAVLLVAGRRVDVDAQDLAEQRLAHGAAVLRARRGRVRARRRGAIDRLAVAARIAGAAAIALRDVEKA